MCVAGREGSGWSFGGTSLGQNGKVSVIVRHPALSILDVGYGMRMHVVYKVVTIMRYDLRIIETHMILPRLACEECNIWCDSGDISGAYVVCEALKKLKV